MLISTETNEQMISFCVESCVHKAIPLTAFKLDHINYRSANGVSLWLCIMNLIVEGFIYELLYTEEQFFFKKRPLSFLNY